jgi:hypothetical protein
VLKKALTYDVGAGERLVQLADYVAASPAGCNVCLRREQVQANEPVASRELVVSLSMTLQQALEGQCIVEFPRFRVSLKEGGLRGPCSPGQHVEGAAAAVSGVVRQPS